MLTQDDLNFIQWLKEEARWLSQMVRSIRFPSFWRFDLPVIAKINSSNVQLGKGGEVLFDHYASVGNVTTGETDLYSDTTAKSTLADNGDKLIAKYGGAYIGHATATRQFKAYFSGTQIFNSGAVAASSSGSWTMDIMIIRVSATVVRYRVSMIAPDLPSKVYTSCSEITGLDLTTTNILKITGQAGSIGAATDDIVAKLGTVSKVVGA